MLEGLFQPFHLLVILIIILILFGPGKMQEMGSAIGKAIRGFKKAMNDINLQNDSTQNKPTDIKKSEDSTQNSNKGDHTVWASPSKN